MEDPSITKRLIDFGDVDHEYDEVPEESDDPQEQQLLQSSTNKHNRYENNNIAEGTTELPPELPPPKSKSVKSSIATQTNTKLIKTTKSKSKIPRSPSHASLLNNNKNQSKSTSYQQQPTILPPQTPPLPAAYQQRSKTLLNGSAPQSPTSPTSAFAANLLNNNNNNNASSGVLKNTQSFLGSNNVGTNSSGMNGGSSHRGSLNMASARRPQLQVSSPMPVTPTSAYGSPGGMSDSPGKGFQYLTVVVRKDENGYGMKVSGDNPVFVESVKPGGAAQIAGLIAGDMILKVNGQEVRCEKHPTVVSLIKASTNVELAVKRSQKLVRPTSVGIVPSTPVLSGRDRTASITGPQPVDSIKRREMETYKIQTLQKMLEQEKLNLERLKGDTNNPSYKLSEANIKRLREQLRQVGAEDTTPTTPNSNSTKFQQTQSTNINQKNSTHLSSNQIHHLSAMSTGNYHHSNHNNHQQQQQQQATTPQTHSSQAFLSLLPRSLSSLSLGTRKNKIDKDLITTPTTTFTPLNSNTMDFLNISSNLNSTTTTTTNTTTNSTSTTNIFPMSVSLHQTTQLQQQQQHLFNRNSNLSQQQQQQQRGKETPTKSANGKNAKKHNASFAAQTKNFIEEDIPPPLPQRNPPRNPTTAADNFNNNNNSNNNIGNNTPISDLDILTGSPQRNSPQPTAPLAASATAAQKKRAKTKTKALSDPKMSTQIFLQMETATATTTGCAAVEVSVCGESEELDCVPPPLPPRQPGMLEEVSALKGGSIQNLQHHHGVMGVSVQRAAPNSLDTQMNYPLVSTCTPVHRDNLAAAFPLSQRPNIVQQLQQHQQQQQAAALGQTPQNIGAMNKHRRVVSSPDNMHVRHPDRSNKTTSGSWDLVEKDCEETPPGTPPPPYLTMPPSSEDAADSTAGAIFIDSHHFTPLTSSPVTPMAPPPAHIHSIRGGIQAAQSTTTQKEIISMEDEDASDQEGPYIDENGPFNNLQRLLEGDNVAFLAVFLNYVLSNSEPAPLLFYLITGLYKEGTAKDMRKWAYEIHSTFLVPRAPLVWYRLDESLAREVDNVLQSEFDKVDLLRKVFWKSRKCARLIITEQLREFQQKRTAGLGTIYGPTDAQLAEAKGDKQREQHIFEETLLRKLQILIEDYEKDHPTEDPSKLALCSALSTVIHRIFITRNHPNNIVDRVHHFVSREKSFKSRLMGKNRKMVVRGHPLILRQYYEVTHCNHCQNIIWGVSPQGYHCTDCKLNIHRPCSKVLDINCPGPLPAKKSKDTHNDNKISKIMGKIRTRTSNDFIAAESVAEINERLHSTSIVRQPSDRRPDASALRANNNASIGTHNNELQSSFHESKDMGTSLDSSFAAGGGGGSSGGGPGMGSVDGDGVLGPDGNMQDTDGKDARRERLQQQHLQNKSAPVSVNRSESYKERLSNKRNRSRRKTSDPSLTSRPNDDQSDLGLSNSNYTASSNSSLSSGGGSESPSTSMEQVANATTNVQHQQQHHHHHPQHAHSSSMHGHHGVHHAHQHSHQDSFHSSSGGSTSFWGGSIGSANANHLTRQWNFDTDEEDDLLNEADWSSLVASDILAALTDAEKKRQEIINEIYQTERNHVRTLKLLERLFFLPLQESGVIAFDHLLLLFPPALGTLRDLHGTFEQKLKQRRMDDNHVVGEVGDLLAQMFDGQSGEELREYAAQFCARQQIALEALKEKRRKDEQLQKLLTKAESHKACRRLQLKDLLPTVLQRLTKYPLLFENLYKVTVRVMPENTIEAEAIQRSLESSKKILVDVNQAVKTAEDAHKLQNIQRKLDKSTFDKDEFKNLDLTQYRLIFDGNLTLKKSPTTQLHSLLFEDMIVLLTKQDDKYSLKYLQQHSTGRNNEVNNKPVSPIMSIVDTIARQDATDKNTFFLIKTKSTQMLELRAASSSESKTWFKHITDAAEQYKRSKHATTETVDDPAIVTIPHSNKDSLELTSERPAHLAATATMTITPLAPMLPPPTATAVATTYITPNNNNIGSNDSIAGVQLRHHNRRESTPTHTVSTPPTPQTHTHAQQQQQQQHQTGKNARHSHNELTPSTLSVNSTHSGDSLSPMVNRTMSTRSCGETPTSSQTAGVTLRHTQSARQANAQDLTELECSRRDSNSIVYAHNPNNTLTLLQTAPPLIDPSAVQISITPVHICETPVEKLRRVDGNVREGLLEKQRIICDLFRLPVEHFHEIVDIAAMPEAPKDSADIALAAYAQVQNLTEVLNEYLQISAAQENAVNNLGCDQCFDKQKPLSTNNSNSSNSSSSSITPVTVSEKPSPLHGIPPPLPPPNKQQPAGQTATPNNMPKLLTPIGMEQGAHIHEDDDGYCEIDELRLPALPHNLSNTNKDKVKEVSNAPPLPPPAGSFKAPPPPPPPPPPPSANVSPAKKEKREAAKEPTSELTKRQSTISADSIPEESAEDITRALAEDNENQTKDLAENKIDQTEDSVKTEICEKEEEEAQEKSVLDNKNVMSTKFEPSSDEKKILKDADTQTKLSLSPNNVVNTNTTTIITIGTNNNNNNNNNSNSNNNTATYENCQQNTKTLNGPIRIQHAHNLEPSVPCHALSSIVCALNTHISLLLPTINERDIERERLRKENQQLRDLLNTMQQERTRVDANMETPSDITLGNTAATSANDDCRKMAAEDECDGTAVTSNSNNTQNNNNNNKLNGQTTTEITITEPVDEDKLANATTLVTISNENLKENITTESVTNETD